MPNKRLELHTPVIIVSKFYVSNLCHPFFRNFIFLCAINIPLWLYIAIYNNPVKRPRFVRNLFKAMDSVWYQIIPRHSPWNYSLLLNLLSIKWQKLFRTLRDFVNVIRQSVPCTFQFLQFFKKFIITICLNFLSLYPVNTGDVQSTYIGCSPTRRIH